MSTVLTGERRTEIEAEVERLANSISDPCSIAQGSPLGLADMGLIRDVTATEVDGGLSLHLTIRLTAPGCLYYAYFERELRTRAVILPGVVDATVSFDDAFDWTPDMISTPARERLARRRRRLLAELAEQAPMAN